MTDQNSLQLFADTASDYASRNSIRVDLLRDDDGWFVSLNMKDEWGAYVVTIPFIPTEKLLTNDAIRHVTRRERDKRVKANRPHIRASKAA